MDLYWVGDIDYPTDYEDKDTQFRMALLQTAALLSPNNQMVQQIIDTEVIKMIAPPDEVANYLQKIGQAGLTAAPEFANLYGDEKRLVPDQLQDNIYGGEIQDKGVTTNDPIARQLVMLGVGR